MRLRRIATLTAILALMSGPAMGAKKQPGTKKKVAAAATTAAKSTSVPKVPPLLSLEQVGTYVSPSPVKFEKGTIGATMTHDGESNFQVHLVDPSSGEKKVFLANQIGKWTGQIADSVNTSGGYLVSVVADGRWTLKIEHPRPSRWS